MKIIFSRKGFDETAGGCPSPIVGKMPISLPVPRANTGTKYLDITVGNVNLGEVVGSLSGGRVRPEDECSSNPDLGRVGAFCQGGPAQAHLARNKLEPGDLFLFFGLFRQAETGGEGLRFSESKPEHYRLFGWLEMGGSKHLPGTQGEEYAQTHRRYRSHPNFRGQQDYNNTAYFPAARLSYIPEEELPGYGRFKADHPMALLSVAGRPPGTWKMPDWFNPHAGGKGRTFRADSDWEPDNPESGRRAQELIAVPQADRVEEMHAWLRELFNSRYLW